MFNKTKYLFTSLLFIVLGSSAQEIKFAGTTDKKFDGNKIVLYNRATGDHDSAVIQNGKFAFTVKFKEPTRYFFYSQFEQKTKGGYSPYGILVTEPGTVIVNADAESFSNTKVKGAKENDLYKRFAEISSKVQKKIMDDLILKYGKEFINNRKPDTSDIKYKQLIQDYNEMITANQKTETERLTKFIKANPGSFAAMYLLDGNARTMELPVVEELYNMLLPKYKESRSGKSIAQGIEATHKKRR